jgi:type IV pilus assembly protein PilQ
MTQYRTLGVVGVLGAIAGSDVRAGERAPPRNHQVARNHVRAVRVVAMSDVPGGAIVELESTSPPEYALRADQGGTRLALDLKGSDVWGVAGAGGEPGVIAPITESTGVVGGVLTQAFKESGLTRLTINLAKAASYRVRTEGSKLLVMVMPSGTSVTKTTRTAGQALLSHDVQDVKFERVADHDRVVVRLNRLPRHSVITMPDGRLRLEMRGTRLPEGLERALDVSAYKGAIKVISAFHDAAAGMTTVEVQLAGNGAGELRTEDNSLVWAFALPEKRVARGLLTPKDGGAVRHTVTVAREPNPPALPKIEQSISGTNIRTAGTEQSGFTSAQAGPGNAGQGNGRGRDRDAGDRHYVGRRVDLDLKDADIHNILRLLSDVGKVNIVTADDVSGSITIRMRDVPWDKALEVVLKSKSLGMVRSGNLIRVAPLGTLQKERELSAAQAKAEFESAPLSTRLIPVSYAQADELQARAKDLISPRGSIAVDERTNVLIARDIEINLNHIEELVRSLDTQTPQVLVEARIVEATSRYVRDVGIQWGGDLTFSEATGNPTGIAFPSKIMTAGGAADGQTPTAGLSPFSRIVTNPNFAVNLPAAAGTGAGGALGLAFGSVDNLINLNVRLSAAESSGLIRVVSSPRILTLDNKEARISQGTLLPYSQVSSLGVQTSFQEAKLQLSVKPHVTADGSVAMHVSVTRDEPDFNQTSARGDPTILKRSADTDLLVMDGHTAVIGGIYTRNTGRGVDQVPFFGDIPVLGLLFQKRRASDARQELVIFLTPRIVNRAEALGR